MSWAHAGALLGGLGLFLLGMNLLTDGLKVAAGDSLRDLLGRWTKTRLRALAAGFAFTALLQSSSAVTVAVIGFVNASMLSLLNATWVVFGANVGTTMTAWIVSLIGLKLKIGAMALPMIGIGMALRLTGSGTRRAAYGDTLAGFGLFFLGISILSDTFSQFADEIDFVGSAYPGLVENIMFVGAGFFITVMTQSSSASIAVALTAAAGGLMPLEPAASLVIGANLGTTSTALFAVIGATPAAKRVAVAHLLFNLITGTVAILLLPIFIASVAWFTRTATLPEEPAVFLAMFHTVFNIVGVILIFPIANRLVSWLSKRFANKYEEDVRLHYLDETTLGFPALAAKAVSLELSRLSRIASTMITHAASDNTSDLASAARHSEIISTVAEGISRYLGKLYSERVPNHITDALVHASRSLQHYVEAAEIARNLSRRAATHPRLPDDLDRDLQAYIHQVSVAAGASSKDAKNGKREVDRLRQAYTSLKQDLLTAGGRGDIDVRSLDVEMHRIWSCRRAVVQLLKGKRRLARLSRTIEEGEAVNGDDAELNDFDDAA